MAHGDPFVSVSGARRSLKRDYVLGLPAAPLSGEDSPSDSGEGKRSRRSDGNDGDLESADPLPISIDQDNAADSSLREEVDPASESKGDGDLGAADSIEKGADEGLDLEDATLSRLREGISNVSESIGDENLIAVRIGEEGQATPKIVGRDGWESDNVTLSSITLGDPMGVVESCKESNGFIKSMGDMNIDRSDLLQVKFGQEGPEKDREFVEDGSGDLKFDNATLSPTITSVKRAVVKSCDEIDEFSESKGDVNIDKPDLLQVRIGQEGPAENTGIVEDGREGSKLDNATLSPPTTTDIMAVVDSCDEIDGFSECKGGFGALENPTRRTTRSALKALEENSIAVQKCDDNGTPIRRIRFITKKEPLSPETSDVSVVSEDELSADPKKKRNTSKNIKLEMKMSKKISGTKVRTNKWDEPPATQSLSDMSDSSARSPAASDCSGSTSKNISSQKKISGKLTKKNVGLHKLVFMNDILPQGTEVTYVVRGEKILEGYVKDSGIYCKCCETVVCPSQFEAHAGHAKRRKPYNHIYTSNGVSLHELSVSLSKDIKKPDRENDTLCSICKDGGDLILCDLCPRAFHIGCIELSSIPKGDWHCRYCESMHQRDKVVKYNDNAIAAGRVEGVDPIMQIYKRCIRIVETPETDVGGCVYCRHHDFLKSGFGPRTVLLCDQCEKEYHVGCLKEHNMDDLKELPRGEWFCSTHCKRIHAALQEFLVLDAMPVPGVDTDIIKRKHMENGLNKDEIVDVRWRLLSGKQTTSESGKQTTGENKLLLSKVVSIFHETFDPILDGVTARNLIPLMVYGKSIGDQDFGGMYCALLTVDSSVVSAGILRVLGCEVAELPLVATMKKSQGQGCFQALFSCIERLLVYLKVKHLVLPAAAEAENIWTQKFGFARITQDQLREYTRASHLMGFQGTSMLHKLVSES